MRTVLVVLVALLLVGCANSFYHIDEGAITQYQAPAEPPRTENPPEGVVVDGAAGPPERAAAAEPGSDGGTAQEGTGNRQQTVHIGGRNAPATDADLEATIRDLFPQVD